MHFVDDVNLEAPAGRGIQRVFEQIAHIVDLRVGSGVELDQIDKTSAIDFNARPALAAGLGGNAGFAVERLGDNAREGGLAHAARAGKQIGMMQALLLERIGKRRHHVLLPDQFGKGLGTPLARENLTHFRRGL